MDTINWRPAARNCATTANLGISLLTLVLTPSTSHRGLGCKVKTALPLGIGPFPTEDRKVDTDLIAC
jgi:hypothetical protein